MTDRSLDSGQPLLNLSGVGKSYSGAWVLKDATFSPQRDASAQVRADGSTVDADTEAAAQARNGLEYETLVQVSKARVDIIEAAMGR